MGLKIITKVNLCQAVLMPARTKFSFPLFLLGNTYNPRKEEDCFRNSGRYPILSPEIHNRNRGNDSDIRHSFSCSPPSFFNPIPQFWTAKKINFSAVKLFPRIWRLKTKPKEKQSHSADKGGIKYMHGSYCNHANNNPKNNKKFLHSLSSFRFKIRSNSHIFMRNSFSSFVNLIKKWLAFNTAAILIKNTKNFNIVITLHHLLFIFFCQISKYL